MAKEKSPRDSRTDFELAQASSMGDEGAFEEIYLRHHRRVYSLSLRMTRNTAAAEDMTQIVFLQLYKKIGSFKGDSRFTTWLHRLTVNEVLMSFRKRYHCEQVGAKDNTVQRIIEFTKVVEPDDCSHKIDIERALKCLPEGYYNVFVLHDMVGYEHKEVAKILGVSEGTSKSQLHKARLKLQGELKKKRFSGKVFDWSTFDSNPELSMA